MMIPRPLATGAVELGTTAVIAGAGWGLGRSAHAVPLPAQEASALRAELHKKRQLRVARLIFGVSDKCRSGERIDECGAGAWQM